MTVPLRNLLATLLFLAGGGVLYLSLAGWHVASAVRESEILSFPSDDGKSAFRFKLDPPALTQSGGDDLERPAVSKLILFEDGQPLGPAHSVHTDIAALGKGRYSHWVNEVIFSSSDGTNPQSNDRTYSYTAQFRFRRRLLFAGVACVAGAFWLVRKRVRTGVQSIRSKARRFPRLLGFARVVLVNIGLVMAGLSLVFIAGEIYFRLSYPFWNSQSRTHFVPSVGFLYMPNTDVIYTDRDEFWAVNRSNSLGFLDRAPPLPEEAAAGCHVAVIGDSFVEAVQVPIPEKVQVRLEELAARQLPELRISTSAYGYSGTGQLNELPFYDEFARKFSPKIVVLVFVINDFPNNSSVLEALRYGWDPEHPPRVFATRAKDGTMKILPIDPEWHKHLLTRVPDPPSGILTSLEGRLWFLSWLRSRLTALGLFTTPAQSSLSTWAEILQKRPQYANLLEGWQLSTIVGMGHVFLQESLPPVFREAMDFTGFALDEFKRRAERDGASLVILSTHSIRESGDRVILRLKEMAEKRGIPVVDQFEYIKRAGGDMRQASFPKDGHWTAAGHQWAAEALVDFLKRNPALCTNGTHGAGP